MTSRTNAIRSLFKLAVSLGASVGTARAETVTYYYTNQQGTPLATADASGGLLSSRDYRPYGGQVLGAQAAGPGYTGHVNDPDSGLVYMQARYYDPLGRMLSVDPNPPKAGNLYSFNRFAYSNNNPASNVDPDGRVVVVNGSATDVASFQALTYRMTGENTVVFNGTLMQQGSRDAGVGYAGAAGALNGAINSKDTITVNPVASDSKAVIDSFVTNSVDLGDFSAFEGKSSQFAAAAFTHFLVERTFDATKGSGAKSGADFASAHQAALGPEAGVMGGSTRLETKQVYLGGTEVHTATYLDSAGKPISTYTYVVDSNNKVF